MSSPLISCICVTRNRVHLLKRVIDCFNVQTYSARELVIVIENDDQASIDFLKGDNINEKIKVIVVERSATKKLGFLRNTGIQNASGEYVCQWDDDDWYHARRLEHQFSYITSSGKDGSVLTRWLMFDSKNKTASISPLREWEGSIVVKKETVLSIGYQNTEKLEDTPVVEMLRDKNHLCPINYTPQYYIYNFHGNNTWDYNHFKNFFNHSIALPPSIVLEIQKIMEEYDAVKGSAVLDNLSKEISKLSKPWYLKIFG